MSQAKTYRANSMELGTIFKLSLYGLVAAVGTILGFAESEGYVSYSIRSYLLLPFLSLPFVVFGYRLTEQPVPASSRAKGISSIWANTLGILALMATAYEFSGVHREGKLLAGTHLLLYVTWIVLFQQKTIRLYWFLMALGILQLAVASVLTNKTWFGVCAVGYMFGAVWTLSIFSLWRAELAFRLGIPEAKRHGPAHPKVAASRRFQPSEVRSAVQHEDGAQWLTVRFLTGVLMTTSAALLISMAFFVFIPRVWIGPEFTIQEESDLFTGQAIRAPAVATVKLGEIGPALESVERVFEIRLTELATGQNITVQDYSERLGMAEPLFRGAVLSIYENGRWHADRESQADSRNEQSRFVLSRSSEGRIQNSDVRQDIRAESNSNGILFCLGQSRAIISSKGLKRRELAERTGERHGDRIGGPFARYNEMTNVTTRNMDSNDSHEMEYHAFTALPKVQQSHYRIRVTPQGRMDYVRHDYTAITKSVPDRLVRLKDLARTVIQEEVAFRQKAEQRSEPRELTNLEIATALETYLRELGHYKYTLDLTVKDPKIDPVEDFLFNRKEGHCEYFATALALMIRSAGVPARVVSGYKGGIQHTGKNNAFEVQQRFSHLWVEAWVGEDSWTTFDATPLDSRSLSIADFDSKKTSLWTDLTSSVSGLWSQNILNMSLDRQEESIYGPMRQLALALVQFARQLFVSPRAAFATLWSMLQNREQWLSVGGTLFALLILGTVVGIVLGLRRAWKWFRAWYVQLAHQQAQQRRRIIAFYERFVQLMKTQGISREPSQTQLEFADQISRKFMPELESEGLMESPGQISNLFYRVRFGDAELSSSDLIQLENMLTRLEKILASDGSPRRSRTAKEPNSV